MSIHNFGARFPRGRAAPGWIDIVGQQSATGIKNEVDTYTINLPGKYRRFILLGIGVGGSSSGLNSYTAGGGGGSAAKCGLILPPNDTLTIVVPRASYSQSSTDPTWQGFIAPSLIVSSAARGPLMTVGAGQNASGATPGGGGTALLHASDFPVQNGYPAAGSMGGAMTGNYEGLRGSQPATYAGGGAAGAHGNMGALHGPAQLSQAFANSLAQALQKLGATAYRRTSAGGASWSVPNSGPNTNIMEPKEDTSFGGGTGGGSGNATLPGRAFFRIAFGLTTDGGNINPANTGW